MPTALLIGNSDGIGLATTRRLLDTGWSVTGLSRSESPIEHAAYRHRVVDVAGPGYADVLAGVVDPTPDLCVYLVGIGEAIDLADMRDEVRTFEVNLTGMVRTAAGVIPGMVARKAGHFVGLSSLADELVSHEAPSYPATKAGFSNYLAGLAKAVRPHGVAVTNVRFGFVDTKMAKGDVRPMMMPVARAVRHLERVIAKRPRRYTAPKRAIPLVKVLRLFN